MIAVKSKNRDPIKIAGVIVLYNPTIENLLNINSYIDALDLLYAIDNSEQPKTSVSDFLAKYKKVKYIPLNENAGIAYALNLAARNSIEEGFSHLLTMDQDSCADDNMMSELLNAAEIFSDAGIITHVQMNKFSTPV